MYPNPYAGKLSEDAAGRRLDQMLTAIKPFSESFQRFISGVTKEMSVGARDGANLGAGASD